MVDCYERQPEFFVVTCSFPAPFVGDTSMLHMNAKSAQQFIDVITVDEYNRGRAEWYHHPSGLFRADIYDSADSYHKGLEAVASWRCPE